MQNIGIYEMNETARVICELCTHMCIWIFVWFVFLHSQFTVDFDSLMNNEHSYCIMTFICDELFTWRSLIFVWFCKHSAYCISGDIYSWFIQLILWRFLLINVMKYTYLQRLHLSFVVVIVVSVYQGKSVISCCCSCHCCCCCCFKCVCLTINSNPLLLLLFHCLDKHPR